MGKIVKYVKRGIKYVIHEHVQPIVKVEVVQHPLNNQFSGKLFLITGGGSGLGFEIAKRIILDGGEVVITGRNEEKLKKAVDKLGNKSSFIACDVQNVKEVKTLVDRIFQKFGHLDGVVNNAGVSLHEWDFLKVAEDGFNSQFNTNLRGGYFIAQEYIKKCLELKKEGNIIFMSSERGTMCDDLPYGLTKRAVDSLVEALSFKYYKNGIRVNAIAPGVTATDMTKIDRNSDLYSDDISGRVFVPEEVAEVAVFLLSDSSKCISGQIIHTNGGNHIKRGY